MTDTTETPKKGKRTLLGAMNTQTLSQAQDNTKNIARKVKSENHKQKPATVIPEKMTLEGGSPVKVLRPLLKQLKILAAQTDSTIETIANEAIYGMLLKKGMIQPDAE